MLAQESLCTLPEPDCPVAISIPSVPGRQTVCSYDHLYGGGTKDKKVDTREIKKGLLRIHKYQHMTQKTSHKPTWGMNYFRYTDKHQIDYGIVCDNGIEYAGKYEWEERSHDCQRQPYHNCSDPEQVWKEHPVQNYGPNTFASEWRFAGKANTLRFPGTILDQWAGRQVGTQQYTGGAHKLAVPVLMIAGLGFDYKVWGVEPAGEVGSEPWLRGEVLNYHNGSLPDMISSAYNLSKGSEINNNGIFFLNVDPSLNLTQTNLAPLGDRIQDIALNYFGSLDMLTKNFQVDIVCHSTACLAVREFIELANQSPPDPVYGFHPVNHIRKIITVNAPHLGTELGKPANQLAENIEYAGLSRFMEQMEGANDKKLMHVQLELDYSDLFLDNAECHGKWYEKAACYGAGIPAGTIATQLADMGSEVAEFLGYDGWDTFNFRIKGGFFGPHYLEGLFVNEPISEDLVSVQENLYARRQTALEEQQKWFTRQRLQQGYPKRPDGSYIDLFPFYSDRIEGIEVELVQRMVGKAFDKMCVGSSKDSKCFDVQAFATSEARRQVREKLNSRYGVQSSRVTFEPWFEELLNDLRTGWFAHSDVLVERSSQTWGLNSDILDENNQIIPELHRARTYNNHYADYPEGHPARPVLHAPLKHLVIPFEHPIPLDLQFAQGGAPLMGMDLFCALDPACASLTAAGRDPIYMGPAIRRPMPVPTLAGGMSLEELATQVVELMGDFAVTPLVSGELTGIAVQNDQGENLAVVGYTPEGGTYLWLLTDEGEVEILLPPEVRPQFQVERSGSRVLAKVVAQTGATTEVPLVQHAPASLRLAVFGSDLETRPARLMGAGTPAQVQSPLPVEGSLLVMAQEKGGQESNQSRPHLMVANQGTSASAPLTLEYYFTADPTRQPLVEIDYPQVSGLQVQQVVGDLWKLSVPVPALEAESSWPAEGALQLRLHYTDWSFWNTPDDYSVGNGLVFMENEKVLLRDAFGRIAWGRAPLVADYTPQTQGSATPMALSLNFHDGGVHEPNVLRPRLTLYNQDGRALAPGYRLVLALPNLGEELPLLTRWYDEQFQGTLFQHSGTTYIQWTALHPLHAGQQISLGEWGVHWPNWAPLDKSGLRQLALVVLDAQGNVLHGSWDVPSVPQDSNGQPARQLQATFWDAGALESNMLRPRVEITHSGGASLESGYVARLCLPWPNAEALPQITPWHAPQFYGEMERDNQNLCLNFHSQARLFEGQTLSVGDWGVYYTDWRPFDKSGVNQATLEIFDHEGARVYP